MVRALTRQTGQLLSQKALTEWRWRGRAVKLVDGTGLSIPDTPENQAAYPQPSSQASGVGFPLARLVMVVCLATGAALDTAIGPHQGKGSGELGLVRRLLDGFTPGRPKPATRPQWMTPEQYANAPDAGTSSWTCAKDGPNLTHG